MTFTDTSLQGGAEVRAAAALKIYEFNDPGATNCQQRFYYVVSP
jgi:hypothetical protein